MKYVFLVNNVAVIVNASDKKEAIDKFAKEYVKLFNERWEIVEVAIEIYHDENPFHRFI